MHRVTAGTVPSRHARHRSSESLLEKPWPPKSRRYITDRGEVGLGWLLRRCLIGVACALLEGTTSSTSVVPRCLGKCGGGERL